ncbi:hypothetical protein AB0C29_46680 [Actinoplanes sp. NPDC048791]|uniref:hypothetical protein n=1 Tax=Actinoplanes sp. NPDC048791 TaxID=3154623 RepID=UPI00340067BF
MQRPWPGSDDRPHVVPGFDDPEPVETAETTTWLHRDAVPEGDAGDVSGDVAGSASRPVEVSEAEGRAAGIKGSGTDRNAAGQAEDGADTDRDAAGRAEEGSGAGVDDVGGSGSRPDDGADGRARPSDDRGPGKRPGEGTDGAVSVLAASSPGVDSGSEPDSAAADEAAEASRPEDDDAETTADVTGRPAGTDADSDSTVVISRNELRQALPQQSTPADGEKTQVIRVRRDDGPAT